MESSSSSNKRPVSTTRPAFLTRPISLNKNPTRKQTIQNKKPISDNNNHKKTTKSYCMCSPTTHPGSFRCSLHKNNNTNNNKNFDIRTDIESYCAGLTATVTVSALNGRRLVALIRPSYHQQRLRGDFTARPSRLRFMSKAG